MVMSFILLIFVSVKQNTNIMYFTKTIQSRLQSALEVVNETFPTINRGGCGVFAVMIHDTLAEMGIPSEFHMICAWKSDVDKLEGKTDIEGLMSIAWEHVVVSVDNYLIDSSGIYTGWDEFAKETKWGRGLLSKPLVKEMVGLHVEETRYWNPTFDRDLVPQIEENFTNAIKKVA